MTRAGTLIVSRAKELFPSYKRYLERLGFKDVYLTSCEKDGLNRLINELKPRKIFIESCFYESATPYMMGCLLRDMPKLNITAFSIGEFPDDLAMWFYFHGVKNYVNLRDGFCELRRGLRKILAGEEYRSRKVQERIDLRTEIPRAALDWTGRQNEVFRLLCNGFTTEEVADELHISKRTVETHKTDLYAIFHVRNERELIRVGYFLDLFDKGELCFYGGPWVITPLPEMKTV